jgi:tripeptide aminopeptidase
VEEDSPLIDTLKQVFNTMGLPIRIESSGGGSDTNHFNNNGNLPAVNLSVGMDKPHTLEEFIIIDDFIKAAEMVVEIIKAHA